MNDKIIVKGARENNLKNINIELPKMSPNCRNFVAFLLSINFIHEKYHLMYEIISNTWNYLLFFIIIIVHTTGDSIFRWFVLVLELRNVQRVKSSPYNQENLVKKLETSGVGRPSTYATIVETVLSATRGYAELQDKSIVPTERGMQLAAFLDRNFNNIINIDYTKKMEENLDKIASGKETKLEFLTEFYNTLENTIKNNSEISASAQTTNEVCPLCGAPMVVRRSRFGSLFLGCSKYPKCRGIKNLK